MLTEATIRAAKPLEKAYKLRDDRGLYLLVTSTGSKLWRLRYRLHGRESMLSLGAYPDVGLKDARERREEARRHIAAGRDPAAARRTAREGLANTFAAVAEEWLVRQRQIEEATRERRRSLFRRYINPWIGDHPVTAITIGDVLGIIRRLEARGLGETTLIARQHISKVLRYAIATGRGGHDVTADLVDAIEKPPVEHHPALTDPAAVGKLLQAIDTYPGQPSTLYCLRLLPYVFTRPKELRRARWEQLDLEAGAWRLPRGVMKMREPHFVPLATQAVAMLKELRKITGNGPWVFPGLTGQEKPMGKSTLLAALRLLGYSDEEHTVHGFRGTASTLLNELGWPPDAIELQLDHRERQKTRAAYNRAQHLPLRRQMMQAWADYLDCLKRGDLAGAAAVGAYGATPSPHPLPNQSRET